MIGALPPASEILASMAWQVVIPAAVAGLASGALTALVRRIAPRLYLVDTPDKRRKVHRRAIPLGGGVAVFVASAAVLAAFWYLPSPLQSLLQERPPHLGFLLAGALVIVIVGTLDDLVELRGRQKLVGQILAAMIVTAGGLVIERIVLFGWELELGPLAVPLTLFWLLGAINAVNLLDGIDGLASVLGIILSGATAVLAALSGHPSVAIIAVVFAGSLLGFLRFNFPPASIFLGDAGSMLIGLMVGALAIHGSFKGPGTVLLAAPLAVWTIPVFDSAAAILRRKLSGRSIYTTDRGHLHHRLLDHLGSSRKVLAFVAVCCLATVLAALVAVFYQSDLIALLTCAALVAICIATGVFGRVEFSMLIRCCYALGLSLMQPIGRNQGKTREATVRLQGTRNWELLWEALTGSAEKYRLTEIQFHVNMPAARESYHASWQRAVGTDAERCWAVELPLLADGHPAGRIRLVGEVHGGVACESVTPLLDLLEFVEAEARLLTQAASPTPPTADPHVLASTALIPDGPQAALRSGNGHAERIPDR
jgi:UDP-GlcNAc:undecaprenyl-phosphate GlcNAc-1-phosphate transferase